jgi:hypothetical protein
VDPGFFLGGVLPDQAADVELCEELESPSSDVVVVAVAAVGIVEIEDCFEGFGRVGEELDFELASEAVWDSLSSVFGDVDASVGVGGEDGEP